MNKNTIARIILYFTMTLLSAGEVERDWMSPEDVKYHYSSMKQIGEYLGQAHYKGITFEGLTILNNPEQIKLDPDADIMPMNVLFNQASCLLYLFNELRIIAVKILENPDIELYCWNGERFAPFGKKEHFLQITKAICIKLKEIPGTEQALTLKNFVSDLNANSDYKRKLTAQQKLEKYTPIPYEHGPGRIGPDGKYFYHTEKRELTLESQYDTVFVEYLGNRRVKITGSDEKEKPGFLVRWEIEELFGLEKDIPELKWARVAERIEKGGKYVFGYQVRFYIKSLDKYKFIFSLIEHCVINVLPTQSIECFYHPNDPKIIAFLKTLEGVVESGEKFRAIAYTEEAMLYVFKGKGFAVCYRGTDNIRLSLSGFGHAEYTVLGVSDFSPDVKAVLDYLRGLRKQQTVPAAEKFCL